MNFFIRRPTWRLCIATSVTNTGIRLYWTDWRKGFTLGPLYVAVVFYERP